MKSLSRASLLLGLTTLVFSGCGEKNQTETFEVQTSNVIKGRDDRRATDSGLDRALSNKVGRLQKPTFTNGVEGAGEGCTATMISKKHAITAAHCLHMSNTGSYVKGIYFTPGMKSDNHMPYGRFHVTKSFFPKSYNSRSGSLSNSDYDIAVVEFGANTEGKYPGDYVGNVSYWGRDTLASDDTLTIGYPGDKSRTSHVQYYQKNCRSYDVNGNVFEFDCDAAKGQSGSALIGHSASRNLSYIYGVISSEAGNTNYGTQLNANRHRIVDSIISGAFSSQSSSLRYNEEWVIQDHRMPVATVNMLFKNNCSNKDLQLAIHYKQMGSGNWITTDFVVIPSGHTGEIARSENGSYYVSATVNSGRSWLTRSDYRFHVRSENRELGFQKINVGSYGDHIQSFNCN